MVPAALAKALVALCEAPMTGPSETLPVLESRLAERLLAFELLGEAWPRGRTAIEQAEKVAPAEPGQLHVAVPKDLARAILAEVDALPECELLLRPHW